MSEFDRELENANGTAFKDLLEIHQLGCANTFFPAGNTFFSTSGGTGTRPDYICVPLAAIHDGRVVSCRVNDFAGDRLQVIPGHAKADHRPLQARIDIHLHFQDPPQSLRWDFDLLVKTMRQGGSLYNKLRHDTVQNLEEHQREWEQVKNKSPSAQWAHILPCIHDTACLHFKGNHRPADTKSVSEERLSLLKQRGILLP